MELKTYRGKSLADLMRRARKELGENALVLETREIVSSREGRQVELVVAADRAAANAHLREKCSKAGASELDVLALSLQELCADDVGTGRPQPSKDVSAEALLTRLANCDVRRPLAQRLLEQALAEDAGEPWTALRDLVARALGATLPPEASKRRVLAFVGPTGVGKTVSAAKLAARLSLDTGRRVGLVASDPYRVGAVEQLGIFADLIGVPLRVAAQPAELDEAIDSLDGCDWVLVDTQGRSPREADADTAWAHCLAEHPRVTPLLVLAATTREADLDTAVDAFWSFKPRGLVFTKIDEASSLGCILNQALRTELPVGLLTNGQRVPQDMLVMPPEAMAELVLGGQSC